MSSNAKPPVFGSLRARAPRVVAARRPGGRHATWLELFFDLVYVVAASNLTRTLLGDASARGALVFLGLFVVVWWAWIGISYFLDQFELRELPLRLLTFTQIALSVGLAVGLPALVEGHPELFAWSYLGLRVTLTALYAWAALTVDGARELCGKYAAGFAVGTFLWGVSLAVDGPARYVLWGVAVALEIAVTVWAYVSSRSIPAQQSHMDERFGLFTIIVLGESVLAVATGGAHVDGAAGWTLALCGVTLAFVTWWLYFDYADDAVIDRALRGGRRALYLSFVYGYTHLLVFAGIVAASAGVEFAFEELGHDGTNFATRLTLCGGLALYVAALSVVQRAEPCVLPARITLARA
ncbi:low temperature requirement protein A, partial [Deinococcus pimensis]|uniref:low temperature requirement protein A n=1 Tax=Deinococcus pimensis TaxID=309888 RepID=UPI000694331B